MTHGVKRPAYQWYPGDFRRDVAVQACSFEARGLWREMLDLMHDGEPYGHLTAGGVPIMPSELARIVGVPVKKVRRWLSELEVRKVFSRTAAGLIYSRRMIRDEDIRQVRAVAGKKGGNPALLVKRKDKQGGSGLLKQTDKQSLTPAVAVAVAVAEDQKPLPAPRAAHSGGGNGKTTRPAPKYPHFPDSDCYVLHEAWRRIGAIDYGRFRRAFAPLFTKPTPDHPVDDLLAAISAFAENGLEEFEAGSRYAVKELLPENFVPRATWWVKWVKTPTQDAEGNLTPKGRKLAGIR